MQLKQWRDRIACDPEIHHGQPCVRGTRVPVSVLVASLSVISFEQVLAEYPQLTREDLEAALYYAAEAVQNA